MQAVILAAGEGLRLRPLTETLPKCLVPVADRTILEYQLEALAAAGVGEVFIVTGWQSEKIEAATAARKNIRTIHNADFRDTNVLYSFLLALRDVRVREELIVIAGDVVFEPAVLQALNEGKSSDLKLCVGKKQCGEEEVKVIGTEYVQSLGKDLDPAAAYGEFLGVFKMRSELLATARRIAESMIITDRKGAYLFNLLNRLITDERKRALMVEVSDLLWEEIDFPEDVERVAARIRTAEAKEGA